MAHPGNCKAEIVENCEGVDQITLCNLQGASAKVKQPPLFITFSKNPSQVSIRGGQVLSWKNKHGEELLFFSNNRIAKHQISTHGGIQIFFPEFSTRPSLESHGCARNKLMKIDPNPPPPYPSESMANSFVNLFLKPSDEDLKRWHHSFEFRMRVTLSPEGDLILTSRIRNINGKPFCFSFVYHTFFSVMDIRYEKRRKLFCRIELKKTGEISSEVRIEGLETLDYLDNLCARERCTEQGDALTFESEVDRVYVGCPGTITLIDHERKRTYVIRKEGLPETVVWNPWEKTKSMVNYGEEDYKRMVCVDAAALHKPITLKPGEEWAGRLWLSVEPSSFSSEHYRLAGSCHQCLFCFTWFRSIKQWARWLLSVKPWIRPFRSL